MRESKFQSDLKKELQTVYPDAIILKLDSSEYQGISDILMLEGKRWIVLECKKAKNASHRPNQDFYVKKLKKMSYAAFIYPENKEEILSEVFKILRPRRKACVSKSK